MNGMDILKGLGHIDERYIQEAEITECKTQKAGWVRILPHAACFALLLLIGFQQFAVRQPTPSVEQADPTADTQKIDNNTIPVSFHNDNRAQAHTTNPGTTGNKYSFTAVYVPTDPEALPLDSSVAMYIRDAAQLEEFWRAYGAYISLDREIPDTIMKYDTDFFLTSDLITIILSETGGTHTIAEIHEVRGTVAVTVESGAAGTENSAQTWVLLELPAGKQISKIDKLKISILDGGNES